MTTEYKTVDGVPLEIGDLVWRLMTNYRRIGKHKVTATDLGMWWTMVRSELFSTERAAVAAAIEREKRNLAKAKKDAISAEKWIVEYAARLKGLP